MPRLPRAPDGRLIDLLDPTATVEDRACRRAEQRALRMLVFELGHRATCIARDVPWGDIAVFSSAAAARARDPARLRLVGRVSAQVAGHPPHAIEQDVRMSGAPGGFSMLGEGDAATLRVVRRDGDRVMPWPALPRAGADWLTDRPPDRDQLVAPANLKGLLRRCHNQLHAMGAGSDDADLAFDMVRLLVARVTDEAAAPAPLRFTCTDAEWATPAGQRACAARVRGLFDEARDDHPGVFEADERITLDDRAICAVAGALQRVRLVPDHPTSEAWDLVGHAYEEYTATATKRRRGQFFTNRLVVDLLVAMVEVRPGERVLDPAGGSGGFLGGVLRAARRAGADQTDLSLPHLDLVEISPRLARIARASLLLQGAPTAGVHRADALAPPDQLPETLRARCDLGAAEVLLTNPPFAGTGDGRITDPGVLTRFSVGQKHQGLGRDAAPIGEPLPEGAPPELLFFERCIRWLAPGGRVGIVLPKSVLDTRTFEAARALLLARCQLLAVVNLHAHTFQPHTGVRTTLLVARRRAPGDPADPPIFMAISRAAGQDSEGRPTYARDPTGGHTDRLDQDLGDIAQAWAAHRAGRLAPSEYRFTVQAEALDPDTLNLNPQAHRPSLNATVRALEAIEDSVEYTVSTVQALAHGVSVYKGPRLRSDDLLVPEDQRARDGVEPYYTPGAVLQGRRDAAKWLDTRRANPRQQAALARVRVQRGDLVLTRSGNIGRVALISSMFDGAIVSDDLIRVRVPDEALRLYLWAWLESKAAQDQIMRNEYGAIQQHLEPEHVRTLLVAIPRDRDRFAAVVDQRRRMRDAREAHIAARDESLASVSGILTQIFGES